MSKTEQPKRKAKRVESEEMQQFVGASVFHLTGSLEKLLYKSGFTYFKVLFRFYIRIPSRPLFILAYTPDGTPLGCMPIEDVYDYLVDDDQETFFAEGNWETIYTFYAPIDKNEPLLTPEQYERYLQFKDKGTGYISEAEAEELRKYV